MRRDDHTPIFDVEADEAADLTDQFWGSSRTWVSSEQPGVDAPARDLTGSMRVIRDGLAAFRPRQADTTDRINRTGRTRQHGAVRPAARREATLAELATRELPSTYEFDDQPPTGRHETIEPLADRLGVGAVDPLLLRLGMVLLIGALLVPLAYSLRPGTVDGAIQTGADAAPAIAAVAAPVEQPSAGSADDEAGSPAVAPDAVAAAEIAPAATGDAATAPAPASVSESAPAVAPSPAAVPEDDAAAAAPAARDGSTDDVATVSAAAERLMPECPQTYDAAAGDSWYRIASAAGVSPDALLDENRATVDTPIFPGDEICLPSGATVPSPPTTVPATTTPATTPPTTAAPTTTTTPPTTAPPASTGEVQALIREIWPDELEEKALQIAFRESRYVATAYNGWCCYGVFQIYWTVHDSWLDDYGIYSSSDLFDARKNITAAYALYQRAGGWGPWGG